MTTLQANGIEIAYDTFGDTAGRPLLLVMGLGAQMLLWDEAFCEQLAAHGHYVVRFDNRDVGLSTKFDAAGVPNVIAMMQGMAAGKPPTAPYSLDDMADDAVALMSALDLDTAHICGASMGGMIAQTIAIRHPQRVRSLVSIMSTTGNPTLPQATPAAMAVLMIPAPPEREANIERAVNVYRTIGSSGFEFDEAYVRSRAALLYDRSFHPNGMVRQMAAILAHGSRVEALQKVSAPTLVIHGDADPLVPIEGGKDTAATIPGAAMLVVEGMGHDLPKGAWPKIIGAITEHTRNSEGA